MSASRVPQVLGLPLGVRRLLVHAYFSKAFNAVASERLRRHGLQPAQEGELVIARKKLLRGHGGAGARRAAVHMVTRDEAASGTYSAWHVVLPLPGTEVRMPATSEGHFYTQWLRFDGIDPFYPAVERGATRSEIGGSCPPEEEDQAPVEPYEDDGDESRSDGGGVADVMVDEDGASTVASTWTAAEEEEEASNWFVLPGDYRALLLKPRHLSWQVLEGRSPPDARAEAARDEAEGAARAETSVRLEFDLPPGAYATMALREASKARRPASRMTHIRFD